MATAFVIARPVSKLLVEVSTVQTTNRVHSDGDGLRIHPWRSTAERLETSIDGARWVEEDEDKLTRPEQGWLWIHRAA